MANYVVDTDGGGSYASVNAAVAAQPATFTEPNVITSEGSTVDTAAVDYTGFNLNGFTLTTQGIDGLYTLRADLHSDLGVTVEDIIWDPNSGGSTEMNFTGMASGHEFTLRRCLLKNINRNTGISIGASVACVLNFDRNIIISTTGAAGYAGMWYGGGNGAYDVEINLSYNIVLDHDGRYNYLLYCRGTKYVLTCKNNIIIGSNSSDFYTGNGATYTVEYNASGDSSADNYGDTVNSLINQVANTTNFTNVTAGSEDFHLPDDGSAFYHEGTPITGITTDYDGESYHATTPSMGVFEYISAGGGFLPYWALKRANILGAGLN